MKLYYSKGACSLAPRIIINELRVNCDFEAVNLKTKQTETGIDFLKINPKGSVPVLMTDEKDILTENAVIQQYLADKYKAEQLLPNIGDFNRYRTLAWLNFISTELHKTCSVFFNASIPQDIKDTIFKPLFHKKLDLVEKNLQNKFLLGNQFTLPDSYLFVILFWLPKFNIDIKSWPSLANYFNELKRRNSIQQALKDEGLVEG